MPLTIVTSPRFADHLTPPGHPERVERFQVMHAVADEFRRRGGTVTPPRPATDEEIERVHDHDYVAEIVATAGKAVALDPDTFTSPESAEVARLAAGAVVSAVDVVLEEGAGVRGASPRGRRALALVRPPGHHAERRRAMGFCLFNNIAIAAAHARARGLHRVAIVDYDVHHGNGTQAAFYDDPSVLFISSHQFPYYPGTGAADEIGSDAGRGYTVNLPLAAGATDADYELVYSRIALPILVSYRPELLLVSAGFDAYKDDPLAGMRLNAPFFGRLTAMLAKAADECCGGRIVAVTEGGYDLTGLAGGLRAVIQALDGDTAVDRFPAPEGDTSRGTSAAEAAAPGLRRHWTI